MSKYRLNMAIFEAYSLLFGITTALCVPYFYAYCTQASNVTVSPENESKEDKNREDDLVHSIRVKEQGRSSLEQRKTKIMKDATVNTIVTMESDATSYKDLPSIKENSQEELNEVDDSSSVTRTRRAIQVEALVHAPEYIPNYQTFVKETSEKRTGAQIDCKNVNNNNLPKKKKFFKKGKISEKWKFWKDFRSRGQSSKSEDSSQTISPLSSVTSGSSSNQGIRSNTGTSLEENSSTLKSQLPIGHSTLRDFKQKVVLTLHEVNGPRPIRIESSSGSNSFIISGGDSTLTRISQSKSTSFRIEIQSIVDSSDQDTDLNEKFCLSSLPGRLRSTRIKIKENLKRNSTF